MQPVLWRRLHYWAALAAALPLLLIIATGLLLQLKKQQAWIQPPEATPNNAVDSQSGASELGGPHLRIAELWQAARACPQMELTRWSQVRRIDLRPERGLAKVVAASGWEAQISLQDGQLLQCAPRRSDLIESLHDGSFFGGDLGKLGLFLPAGVLLLGLWLSGVYMALRRWRALRRVKRSV